MTPRAVVLGNGTLGRAVVRALQKQGETVRVVSRGTRKAPIGAEPWTADLHESQSVAAACEGAERVFHCAMPPYHRWIKDFPALHSAIIAGVGSVGALLVWGDNMYAYGDTPDPRTEQTPEIPCSRKGVLRARLAADLLTAHASGNPRAVIVRAADFYGPHARLSTAGDFVFQRLIEGKSAQWLGDPDVPHAFTHIDDFATAMTVLADAPNSWGQTWHAPTLSDISARTLVDEIARQVGSEGRISTPPKALLRILGLVNPALRETFEMDYERVKPFLVDSGKIERVFHMTPISLQDGVRQTIAWYREILR